MKSKFFYFPNKKAYFPNQGQCPGPSDIVAYYTQITIDGHCCIPEPKPDCEKLISTHHGIQISNVAMVDAVKIKDRHAEEGKKVVVNGMFQLGIQYSAHQPDQKVHFFQCDIPFNAVILDCRRGKEKLFPKKFDASDYIAHVCVEHLQVERQSERTFEKIVVLMIWLQPKYCKVPKGGKIHC